MDTTPRWTPVGMGIALAAATVLLASCGGDSAAQDTTRAPAAATGTTGTPGTTRQAAGEMREIDCPDGWGYGGLKVVNRFPGPMHITINQGDPAHWVVSPESLQGHRLSEATPSMFQAITQGCMQLAKPTAAAARLVVGFQPARQVNYPEPAPFSAPVEVSLSPYLPENKKGKFIGGDWVQWGATDAGRCAYNHSQTTEVEKYGGLRITVECPGTSSYYHYPTVITLSR